MHLAHPHVQKEATVFINPHNKKKCVDMNKASTALQSNRTFSNDGEVVLCTTRHACLSRTWLLRT